MLGTAVFCYCVGAFTALAFLALGYHFGKLETGTEELPGIPIPGLGKRVIKKKKPVSVSELEQWKREQNQAPLDPGL